MQLTIEDRLKIIVMSNEGKASRYIANEIGTSKSSVNRFLLRETHSDWWVNHDIETARKRMDQEVVVENVRLGKQKQRQQDMNRIQNKAFREHARIENAVSAYVEKLHEVFDENDLSVYTKKHKTASGGVVGIIQLSDVHFNEQVDMPHNQYNFTVASQRLRKLAQKAITTFKSQGVTDVVIAMTGDMLNSDRRLDELLSNACNRSKATFIAIDILQQFIININQNFNCVVASVTGNESRVGKDVGWDSEIAQDNYDFVIHNTLKYLFRDAKGVSFIDNEHPLEVVLTINSQKVLLIHGHNRIAFNPDKSMAKKRAQYAAKGVNLDFILMGHVHECHISDHFGRSASLVGANDYSEMALDLYSRASQNIYLVNTDCVEGTRVDLQNAHEFEPYLFDDALESYNSKSLIKTKPSIAIHKIVV